MSKSKKLSSKVVDLLYEHRKMDRQLVTHVMISELLQMGIASNNNPTDAIREMFMQVVYAAGELGYQVEFQAERPTLH